MVPYHSICWQMADLESRPKNRPSLDAPSGHRVDHLMHHFARHFSLVSDSPMVSFQLP